MSLQTSLNFRGFVMFICMLTVNKILSKAGRSNNYCSCCSFLITRFSNSPRWGVQTIPRRSNSMCLFLLARSKFQHQWEGSVSIDDCWVGWRAWTSGLCHVFAIFIQHSSSHYRKLLTLFTQSISICVCGGGYAGMRFHWTDYFNSSLICHQF